MLFYNHKHINMNLRGFYMIRIQKKISVNTIILLPVILQVLMVGLGITASFTSDINHNTQAILFIAIDCSPSIKDDIEYVRKNWDIITDILKSSNTNLQVGIIEFASSWKLKYAGTAKELPDNYQFNTWHKSGSDFQAAIEGILEANNKLDSSGKTPKIGIIISDFWQQHNTLKKNTLKRFTEIDSVYLCIVGNAPQRIVQYFPSNCRVVAGKQMAAAVSLFLKQHTKNNFLDDILKRPLIVLILVIIFIVVVIIVIRNTRKGNLEIEKIGKETEEHKYLIRIQCHYEHNNTFKIFDLNEHPVTVAVDGDIKLPDFKRTSITLLGKNGKQLNVINSGETSFYLNNKTIKPGKQCSTKYDGIIKIPYQKNDKQQQVVIKFSGINK